MHPKTIEWTTGGGRITILPGRGRVFQITVDGTDALWTNPDGLDTVLAGGDRAWAGPEVDWHWKKVGVVDFDSYVMPEPVDPGSWETAKSTDRFCSVHQRCRLQHLRKPNHVEIDMQRHYHLVDLADAAPFADHVAFQTDNELRILGGTAGQPVDFWSILQVPSGGRMIIGCRDRPQLRDYFDPIPAELRTLSDSRIQLSITGRRQYKVGVPPQTANGRMAYVRDLGDRLLVVYRRFAPAPWRAYCDVPPTALDTPGDAIQVYNDDGNFGNFGEMEYHTPALVAGAGNDLIQDTNLTVAGFVARSDWDAWQRRWL